MERLSKMRTCEKLTANATRRRNRSIAKKQRGTRYVCNKPSTACMCSAQEHRSMPGMRRTRPRCPIRSFRRRSDGTRTSHAGHCRWSARRRSARRRGQTVATGRFQWDPDRRAENCGWTNKQATTERASSFANILQWEGGGGLRVKLRAVRKQ